jgi:uncharacterized protein DUF6209
MKVRLKMSPEHEKHLGSAEIVFTKDWKEFVRGELRRGTRCRLVYDSRRLPYCRATYSGSLTWGIVAYIKFKESSEVLTGPLSIVIQQGEKYDPQHHTIMTADLEIPRDAEGITMWFINADRGGCVAFDSRYGQNYYFDLITRLEKGNPS